MPNTFQLLGKKQVSNLHAAYLDCSVHNEVPSFCNLISPLGKAWTILRSNHKIIFFPLSAELAQLIYHHSHFLPSHHCLSVTIRIAAQFLGCRLWTKATLTKTKKATSNHLISPFIPSQQQTTLNHNKKQMFTHSTEMIRACHCLNPNIKNATIKMRY